MKLVHKLIAGFLVVSAMICIAGLYAYKTGYRLLEDTYISNNEALAGEMMDSIDRSIHKRIETMRSYSNDVMLRDTIIKSNQDFSRKADVYSFIIRRDREWTSAPADQVTPFMEQLINNSMSDELREVTDFYTRHYGYKLYETVVVTNKYGVNIAQTGKTAGYRHDEELWWQLAKNKGLYVQDVEYREGPDIYTMDFAIRINDDNGDFIGVIKAVLNIKEVLDIISNKSRGGIYPDHENMRTLLMTREGKVIFSSNANDAFLTDVSSIMTAPDPETERRGSAMKSYFVGTDRPTRSLVTSVRSRGYMEYPGFDWTMLIILDEQDAFAPLFKLRNRTIAVSFSVILMALLTGGVMFSRIAGKVRKLRDASAKIGDGDLSCRIEVESNDEIGDLTSTFNRMVQSLQDRTEALKEEILARKAAEEKSANSAQEWSKTFDSIPDLISIHSNDFRIIRANQALADFLGLKKEEMAGKYCFEVFHGTKVPIDGCPQVKTLAVSQPVNTEYYGIKTIQHAVVSTSPIFNKDHKIIGIVHIVRDTTATKLLEEQLEHARHMESVGRLAGGVAHEFNNIHAAIINYGYLLRDKVPADPDYGNYINRILALADKGTQISRYLLTYSRNRYSELVPLDLNGIIKKAVHLISAFNGNNIQLETLLSDDTLMVMGNATDLDQCIVNLAHNAVEAMPSGGTLTISAHAVEMDESFIKSHGFGAPGVHAVISVTDTGTGLDSSESYKIFEPFFTTKEVGQGQGLGLSVVYGIIKQHEGYIDIESGPGNGTAIKLYLPLINEKSISSGAKECTGYE
ncbi:MAG: ATP-binding protein [Nitrospirota bacterium]